MVKVRIGVSFEELRRGRSSWAAPVRVAQIRDTISPKRPPSDAAAHRSVGGFAASVSKQMAPKLSGWCHSIGMPQRSLPP